MIHEELWEQLLSSDRSDTAKRAMCQYLEDQERYSVIMLQKQYLVDLSEREIYINQSTSSQETAGFLEQLCLLAYLINAQDLPLTEKLVKAESFPDGEFFFRGQHLLPTKKLEHCFGQKASDLYKITDEFKASRCEFGDASIKLYILPRLPLTIVIWEKDDEFPARASLLFDQTASIHLPLDALLTAVNLAIDAIITAINNIN
ncbi:MAG: DUF3786 domain-containing protein [Planctomycetota bacterium]|jgi:hypothetical protein